jgi:hypothetical protein
VAAGANPLIVITDPSDPGRVIVPVCCSIKIRLLHLLIQLLIGFQVTVVCSQYNLHQHFH